jgi:hypothetical protein
MATNEEIAYLGSFIPHFKGVYSCDMIPDIELKDDIISVLIINLDHHDQPGSHFVTLIIDKYFKDKVIYFDPLGLDIFNEHIIKSISNINKHFVQLNNPIQDSTSDFCGLFCLAACVAKYYRTPLHKFLKMFSNKLKRNDIIVYNYLKNFYE